MGIRQTQSTVSTHRLSWTAHLPCRMHPVPARPESAEREVRPVRCDTAGSAHREGLDVGPGIAWACRCERRQSWRGRERERRAVLGRDECGRAEVCARDGVCTTGAEEVQGASSPSAVRLFPAAVGRRELRSAVSSCCGRIVRAACGIQARVQRGMMIENLNVEVESINSMATFKEAGPGVPARPVGVSDSQPTSGRVSASALLLVLTRLLQTSS